MTRMPEITEHAALRYRERVDAGEPYPKERLREIVEQSSPSHREELEGMAVEFADAIAVLKGDVVTTVLRRCPDATR